MNKKKAIKVLSATAIAASAFVATAPAQAATTNSSVESLVKQAKDAGTVLKWAISTEGSADGKTRPYAQYNAAKVARDKAVAAVNKLPAAQKNKYLADIEQNVTLHINRTMAYIDAITAGEKITVKKQALEAQIAKNLIDDKTVAAYHDLSTEIRKQAILLDRVYGQSTRDAIRAQYKKTAETVRDSVKYEVTVKIELDAAQKALAENKQEEAEKHLAEASKYMNEVKNETMKATLAKSLEELEAQLTPKVKSVSAINAKEIVVNFTTALAKGTTEEQLKAAFTLEGKTDTAAKLSEDRKTVTYTVNSTEVTNAKLTVLALDTDKKDAANNAIQTKEYNTVFSFEDAVGPAVAKTEFTHTSDTAADLTLKFSEELTSYGTISVNGVEVAPKSSDLAKGEVVLGDLEVGKNITIDIVGATDAAVKANKAEHITLSLTVPSKVVDSTVPTVSTSTNGNKLTLTFSEEVTKGNVSIGGVAVAANDITTTDNKTFVVDVQKANNGAFFANNTNFFTSEVIVNGFADKASTPNTMKEVKFNSTFTADTKAASLVSAEAKADGKLVLEFNEDVVSPATISSLVVKSIDGIYQSASNVTVSSAKHPVVDGKAVTNKLELTLDAGTQLVAGKNYVLELAANTVEDSYKNKNDKAITLNVVRPEAAGQQPAKVVTTTISEDKNVVTITFANTDAKGMTDSVLAPSNYTIGGKALPANTDIKFVDNKNKVVITLPESFVSVNGTYTFTASNLKDAFGNTLADGENTAQLALTENIAPTVNSALTVNGSNAAVVSFSEAIQSADLDGDGKSFEGITVKVNGTDAAFTPQVSNGKLTVTLTNAITLTDKVTVDFKEAELTDANGNQVKNGVASN
ncbi:hypothetical protein [Cytobacillus dafuensis]|uniref:SbsC C-terminal domain-containing protein n=1 Tax=Cytobacillus dafuensis TaxID=1742359 RepID=A0A5B8Z9K6_CYTDA|nr:hypothetical protein [Cytobacillus dafuensis]QED49668.1 hypothetical protein FSZ17_21670 [Cytobacillus dafuensis]